MFAAATKLSSMLTGSSLKRIPARNGDGERALLIEVMSSDKCSCCGFPARWRERQSATRGRTPGI